MSTSAVLTVTSEFRHNTVTASLLESPRRGRVVTAKAFVAVSVGLALGLAGLVIVLAVGLVSGATQLQLVNGDIASGRLTLSPEAPTPIGWWIGNALHFLVPFVLILLLLMLILRVPLVAMLLVDPLLVDRLGTVGAAYGYFLATFVGVIVCVAWYMKHRQLDPINLIPRLDDVRELVLIVSALFTKQSWDASHNDDGPLAS